MTLDNFLKENKTKLKLTKKLIVRDLDEIEKNTFVAYVDGGKESYDVQFVLDTKKNIINTKCDCEQGGICLHIIALADFINNNVEVITVKKLVKRKLSETDQLLETIDDHLLRNWVSELINKNKEIAFLFKNTFVKKNIVFDKEFVKLTIKECINSIIGKRRSIETNEVKKLVDALSFSLKSILEHITSIPINSSKHKLLSVIADELEQINYDYYISSVKITRLIESIHNELLKSLYNLKDFEIWKESSDFYLSFLFKEKINTKDFDFCKKLYDSSLYNEQQKKAIAYYIEQNINEIYSKYNLDFFSFTINLEIFFLKVYVENDLFESNYLKFRPKKYQNEYNIDLLKNLVKINQLELVEKYCTEQINSNENGKYDIPYVNILIDLYKKNSNNIKLANLLSIYGKYIFQIESYLFIKENLPLDQFKKYHNVVLINARNSYQNGTIEAFDFYYEVKKLNGKTNDLIEMLRNCRHFYFIEKYKEIAIKIDEIKFIQIVLNSSIHYNESPEKIETLANFICNSIEKEKLKFYLRNIPNYSRNNFYAHVEKIVA